SPNRTVSSAGPPSRSSSGTTVIFVAIPASLTAMGYLHRTGPPATRWPGGRTERVTRREAIGNTQTMTGVPAHTLYHRWLGWHALAMRRAVTVLIAGLIVALALLPFATWGMALVVGWDA